MSNLNEDGKRLVNEVAQRHGFSHDAVEQMLRSVAAGQGTQAQFSHPEFGGMGQWSRGGMTMIGDMFNNGLKARVDALCAELSSLLAHGSLFQPNTPSSVQGGASCNAQHGSTGWPAELGSPTSQGSQNDMRYAYFPQTRRLGIAHGGSVMIYDTGDHQIYGFGQAQSGWQSLTFTSQFGQINVTDLQVVPMLDLDDGAAEGSAPPRTDDVPTEVSQSSMIPDARAQPADTRRSDAQRTAPKTDRPAQGTDDMDEQIFSRIERLADLRDRGILSEAEFTDKKTELLSRL